MISIILVSRDLLSNKDRLNSKEECLSSQGSQGKIRVSLHLNKLK